MPDSPKPASWSSTVRRRIVSVSHGLVIGRVLADLDSVFGDVVEVHVLDEVRRSEDVKRMLKPCSSLPFPALNIVAS